MFRGQRHLELNQFEASENLLEIFEEQSSWVGLHFFTCVIWDFASTGMMRGISLTSDR